MTLEELANRLDDAVAALERIAAVLETVTDTDTGCINCAGVIVTREDRP